METDWKDSRMEGLIDMNLALTKKNHELQVSIDNLQKAFLMKDNLIEILEDISINVNFWLKSLGEIKK